MINRRFKIAYVIFFIGTFFFTAYGILKLGEQGGPCNAGLAIIVLSPFLLICSILLGISFYKLTKEQKTNFRASIILSFVSLTIWTYWLYSFAQDDFKKNALYLSLFEVLNILTLVIGIVPKVIIEIKKNKVY